jgi:hypothetical protein
MRIAGRCRSCAEIRSHADAMLLAQRFTRVDDVIAKCLRVNDAREMHVVRLSRAVSRRFKLERAQMEVAQDGSFDKRDILNVFQRDGLLNLKQNALAKAQRLVADLALEQSKVVMRPPLTDAAKPNQREWQSNASACHGEADGDHEIRANERIEFRDEDVGRRSHVHRALDSEARPNARVSMRESSRRSGQSSRSPCESLHALLIATHPRGVNDSTHREHFIMMPQPNAAHIALEQLVGC